MEVTRNVGNINVLDDIVVTQSRRPLRQNTFVVERNKLNLLRMGEVTPNRPEPMASPSNTDYGGAPSLRKGIKLGPKGTPKISAKMGSADGT